MTQYNQDIFFDGIAEQFDEAIYKTSKGFIRLNVLWEDLCQTIPSIRFGKLDILDAGGGMGQVSMRLAKLDNNIVLADPSLEMLSKAQEAIAKNKLENHIQIIQSSIQELHIDKTFDVVMCHAVLEWAAMPEQIISALTKFLKSEGYLSLMFYNQNAAIFKSVKAGDYIAYANADKRRKAEQMLPTDSAPRALSLNTVEEILTKYGIVIQNKSGIRIFHDHIPKPLRQAQQLEALLQIEKHYRTLEPFASLAQHIHLVCRYNVS